MRLREAVRRVVARASARRPPRRCHRSHNRFAAGRTLPPVAQRNKAQKGYSTKRRVQRGAETEHERNDGCAQQSK